MREFLLSDQAIANLTKTELLILGRVREFHRNSAEFRASDQYMVDYFKNLGINTNRQCINRSFGKLAKKGYFKISKQAERRIILLNEKPISSIAENDNDVIKNDNSDVIKNDNSDVIKNDNQNSIKNNRDKNNTLSPQAKKFAKKLSNYIQKHNPYEQITDRQLERWAEDIDKLNRINDVSWNDINTVMVWAMDDAFWRQNIRSGSKFRKQFSNLAGRMIAKAEQAKERELKAKEANLQKGYR